MQPLLLVFLAVTAIWTARLVFSASVRRRSAHVADTAPESERLAGGIGAGGGRVSLWLMRAGYRSPNAPVLFWTATAASAVMAVLSVLIVKKLGVVDAMAEGLSAVPGGIGEGLVAVAVAMPYFVFFACAAAPTLVVRSARRRRVEGIEHDLASALELMATLAEAGLGFDAAVARIQDSATGDRPLNQEFEIYQRDMLGGISRIEALHKLAARTDITSFSIFISALVQAEQVGASLAETLRIQSDDLRERRKLHAILLAQALPVKLVIPLMVCFLPGIFFVTLGPVIARFVDVMDAVIRRR